MNPALRLRYRNALNTMNAAFVSQHSKHRRAAYLEDDFLEAAQFGRAAFKLLEPEAMRFGVFAVHPIKISSKQRGFVPPGAGTNFHNRIAIFVRLRREKRVLD